MQTRNFQPVHARLASETHSAHQAAQGFRFSFGKKRTQMRFDARAGLVYRLAPNVARVDAVLAATVPAGQGHRLIGQIEVLRT